MAKDKDTIYVDIDDEITGIIDKVKASDGKVVALVLPKRAAVFQSIVNMKLLKRAADSDKKHLVLITTEAGLLPLAGAAGVHVAKTLTSKPEIPGGPDLADEPEDIEEEPEITPEEGVPLQPDKTLQEHAAAGAAAGINAVPPPSDDVETVVLDDEDVPPEADDAKPGPKTFEPSKGKDKKLKIPDFDRFRLLLVGGAALLILLLIGFIVANSVLSKATIKIKTDATAVDTNLDLTLSTTAKELDADGNIVPAKLASTSKTYTQSVPTTGQKNNGDRATGSVTMTATECGTVQPAGDVPAGTGISRDGLTYITQERTSFSPKSVSGGCINFTADGPTKITAQNGGSNYNASSGKFSVAGRSDVSATGSASGGTDNIQQVVNQNDINTAKSKITASANEAELKKNLSDSLSKDGYYAVGATYSAGTPNVTTSNNVGEAANNLTVTQTVTYTMFGAKKNDLQTLIKNAIKTQIDISKQSILDDGLGKAVFNVNNLAADKAELTMSTTAEVGPDLDVASIREEAAGQKPGAVKDKLATNPDVTSVDVKLSPFWVSNVPKKTSKIKVEIAKPQAKSNANQ